MKKILSVLILVCFLLPLSLCFAGCKNNNEDKSNGKLTTNLLSFETVGVGYIETDSASSAMPASVTLCSNITLLSNNTKKHNGKLVGIDKNGNKSQIEYKENGKKTDKFKNLIACNSTDRFLFVKYSENASTTPIDTYCLQYSTGSYIIDKNTGNMYEVEINFNLLLSYFGISASDCGDYCVVQSDSSYYKIGVENDKLVFTEILKTDTLPGGCSIRLADIYGNCLVSTGYGKEYVLTNQNTLIESSFNIPSGVTIVDSTYTIRAYDGKIYNNGYVLNDLGEFIETQNIPNLTVLPKEYLVYAENNVEYYFNKLDFNSSTGVYYPYHNKIMKRTMLSNNVVEIESISLDFTNVPYSNIYMNAPYIYTLDTNNNIGKISITTGEKTTITIENVLINSIEPLGLGKILFKGTNLSLQSINGIIDEFGSISYTANQQNFKVFYYCPINQSQNDDNNN